MHLRPRLCLLVGLVLPLTGRAQTVPATATDPAAAAPTTMFSRIRGLFDLDLPQFDPPGTFRLHFNPHLGDFVHRRYLGLNTGVEWAWTDFLQFRADVDAFGTHGFRRGAAHYGIGQLHLGGKYRFQELFRPDFETSVGLNLDLPVGHPPVDFTDGHNHLSPYFIAQHHTDLHPRLTTFAGASLDIVSSAHVAGDFGVNQPHHHSVSLNTGAVYDLGQLKWTLQGTYQTTALIGGAHPDHYFTLRPSVLWYIPKRYTFNGKTQWVFGLGASSVWGPDGHQFSTNSRLQGDLTFSQAIDRLRSAFDYRH